MTNSRKPVGQPASEEPLVLLQAAQVDSPADPSQAAEPEETPPLRPNVASLQRWLDLSA
jgi:hypothetical protein